MKKLVLILVISLSSVFSQNLKRNFGDTVENGRYLLGVVSPLLPIGLTAITRTDGKWRTIGMITMGAAECITLVVGDIENGKLIASPVLGAGISISYGIASEKQSFMLGGVVLVGRMTISGMYDFISGNPVVGVSAVVDVLPDRLSIVFYKRKINRGVK